MCISIIVPCYNEEQGLAQFYQELTSVTREMREYEFEYIFVDDGSEDKTLTLLKQMQRENEAVQYLSFSRNFGKESAMMAGLEAASGDWVAIMDADLQDPPEMLPQMAEILKGGEVEMVATRRVTRKGEPPIRSFAARLFYRLMGRISKTDIVDGSRDYRLMTRIVVDSVLQLREVNRFSKGIFNWVGFKTHWLSFENAKRAAGESKWSFFRLLAYSIEGIVAFSTAPLIIASMLGIIFFIVAFIAIIFVVIREMIWHGSAYGWASTICIFLMVSGVQLFCIGIVGQYLSKAYMEVKKRPMYIVKESSTDANKT